MRRSRMSPDPPTETGSAPRPTGRIGRHRISLFRLFIDANLPAHAMGSAHPLKEPCRDVLGKYGTRAEEIFEIVKNQREY
ncbi:hypothetical protein BH23ACT11_BH23ACT11_03630 [soil metagenome]